MRGENASVIAFRRLLEKTIPDALKSDMRQAVFDEAEELAKGMRARAPARSGNLRKSIRVEPGNGPLQAVVRAGGTLTTKPVRHGSDVDYDYAVGTEFGNEHSGAEPFFWPTYRERKRSTFARLRDRFRNSLSRVVNVE